jgi:hypothetical protein
VGDAIDRLKITQGVFWTLGTDDGMNTRGSRKRRREDGESG